MTIEINEQIARHIHHLEGQLMHLIIESSSISLDIILKVTHKPAYLSDTSDQLTQQLEI